METGKAFFLRRPRQLSDLMVSHPSDSEREYEVSGTIRLRRIDYENFITDMLADRVFLEEYAPICSTDGVWKCILVSQRGKPDGVLVIPEKGCYVGWAALPEKRV